MLQFWIGFDNLSFVDVADEGILFLYDLGMECMVFLWSRY